MQCSDLERYLEAYLDLRLGRSRGSILRRHLAVCPGCRARIDRLRQFERELQQRFRSMERSPSVWNGLEPDLVRTIAGEAFLPPRDSAFTGLRPLPTASVAAPSAIGESRGGLSVPAAEDGTRRHRRWSRRIVGVLLIAAAVGAIARPMESWLFGAGRESSRVGAYLDLVKGSFRLDRQTASVDGLQSWLAGELGPSFRMPQTPEGFTLVGGRVQQLAHDRVAAVVYDKAGVPTILFVRPGASSAAALSQPIAFTTEPALPDSHGLNQLAWQTPDAAYSLVSSLPAAELADFARGITGEPL